MQKLEAMRSIFSKISVLPIPSNTQKTEVKTPTTPLKAFFKNSDFSDLKHCFGTDERPKHS